MKISLLKIKGRKGALWHWVPLSIIVVVLIFLLASRQDLPYIEKGAWQLDFVEQAVLQAEQEDLKIHLVARTVGKSMAVDLAENSGFAPGTISDCGTYHDANLWNKQGQYCFPEMRSIVQEVGSSRLQQALPTHRFNAISYAGRTFFGRGAGSTVVTELARYTYDDSFAIDLKYSFEEYEQLQQEAVALLDACSNNAIINVCIKEQLPVNWKHGSSCQQEAPILPARFIRFCAVSDYTIDDIRVEYPLALDFGELPTAAVREPELAG